MREVADPTLAAVMVASAVDVCILWRIKVALRATSLLRVIAFTLRVCVVPIPVGVILSGARPSEVRELIVGRIAVPMRHLWTPLWSWSYERLQHQAMNRAQNLAFDAV
jgi:hypothetical protein